MKKMYDIAIIGGGIGGLMAAYRLKENAPELKIAVTERGNTLEKRHCPVGRDKTCIHCKKLFFHFSTDILYFLIVILLI